MLGGARKVQTFCKGSEVGSPGLGLAPQGRAPSGTSLMQPRPAGWWLATDPHTPGLNWGSQYWGGLDRAGQGR